MITEKEIADFSGALIAGEHHAFVGILVDEKGDHKIIHTGALPECCGLAAYLATYMEKEVCDNVYGEDDE